MSRDFFKRAGGPVHEPTLDPFSERQVADRLRSALADHANTVEPAPNSYLTLSKRLAEATPPVPKPGGEGNGRVLAAAATFVLVAGAGLYLVSQTRTGDINAVGTDSTEQLPVSTTTIPPTTAPSTAPPDNSTTTVVTTTTPPPEVVATVVDRVDLPVAASEEDALLDMFHLLGLPGVPTILQIDGGPALASVYEDEDEFRQAADVAVVEVDGGYMATGATSSAVSITAVEVDGNEMVVSGFGSSFEGSITVRLVGTDGMELASALTAGGAAEAEPFKARLRFSGTGEGFVVANTYVPIERAIPDFAAVPVRFSGPADDTSYTVFRIRPDDPDDGLILRDRPGSDEGQVLDTLPPGTTGIRRLPEMPALVGNFYWWKVETADGVQGWVSSPFLTPDPSPLSDDEVLDQARRDIQAIRIAQDDWGIDMVRLSRRVPVALGWLGAPVTASVSELRTTPYWIEAGEWPVPQTAYGESQKVTSLRSLMNIDGDIDSEATLGATARYQFEQDQLDNYFAGTRAVTISGPVDEGEPERSAILFYEAQPAGPHLVGATVSIATP